MATEIVTLHNSIQYQEGSIVSKILLKKKTGSITLFAFDAGQELSEHSTPHDAYLQVLDGKAEVTVGGSEFEVEQGEAIHLPADVPHAVRAAEQFKMMLVMLRT